MIWIISATLFFIGLILFGLGYRENERRPRALRYHLMNEEVVGAILMVAGLWTVAIWTLMRVIN